MKKTKLIIATIALTALMSSAALGAEWKQDAKGWWYQNDNGSFTTSDWQIIDGKTYLFDASGYMRTGWIHTIDGKWYYLNPTGEMRYADLIDNGITYHFDSSGFCTNPNGDNGFTSDYQSILDQERLEAEKRLLDQTPSDKDTYEESTVYERDINPQPIKDRYSLSDMQF